MNQTILLAMNKENKINPYSEFICPLDVGIFGNIAQFLMRDCETKEEAIEKLERLGFEFKTEEAEND